MSASAQFSPVVLAIGALINALEELKCAQEDLDRARAAAFDKNGCETADWNVIIGQSTNAPVRLQRRSGGQVEVTPIDAGNEKAVHLANKVKQAYARIRTLNELKAKGYSNVKETLLPDGSVRIVVQKWE